MTVSNCIIELKHVDERAPTLRKFEMKVDVGVNSNNLGSNILMESISDLSNHQADVLIEGMGSLASVVCAPSFRNICDRTPVDVKTAKIVHQYFAN